MLAHANTGILGRIKPLVFVALIAVGSLTMTGLGGLVASRDVFSADPGLEEQEQFDTLSETWDLIVTNYVDEDAIESDELLYGAANGMVEALGDYGHSAFLDPQESDQFASQQQGQLIGIGVQLDTSGNLPMIMLTIPGSPAELAGLKSGDLISAIDGVSVNGLSPAEVSALIRGEIGEPVSLSITRPADSTKFTSDLIRAEINLDPVFFAMLPDGIALIRINEFSEGTGTQLAAALTSAADAKAVGIVLDLRDNPGGYLHEARNVASLLLAEDKIVFITEDRDGDRTEERASGNEGVAMDLPMTVLINGGSASAAEIVAAALRDNGRAQLIGETTFGTGTILAPFGLDDGSTLLLGTEEWLTPLGDSVWKTGLPADIEVALETADSVLRADEGTTISEAQLDESNDLQLLRGMSEVNEIVDSNGADVSTGGDISKSTSHTAEIADSRLAVLVTDVMFRY